MTPLRCTDLRCTARGTRCCLACNNPPENCPGRCPTVNQYNNPEYPGCPHHKLETHPP